MVRSKSGEGGTIDSWYGVSGGSRFMPLSSAFGEGGSGLLLRLPLVFEEFFFFFVCGGDFVSLGDGGWWCGSPGGIHGVRAYGCCCCC